MIRVRSKTEKPSAKRMPLLLLPDFVLVVYCEGHKKDSQLSSAFVCALHVQRDAKMLTKKNVGLVYADCSGKFTPINF